MWWLSWGSSSYQQVGSEQLHCSSVLWSLNEIRDKVWPRMLPITSLFLWQCQMLLCSVPHSSFQDQAQIIRANKRWTSSACTSTMRARSLTGRMVDDALGPSHPFHWLPSPQHHWHRGLHRAYYLAPLVAECSIPFSLSLPSVLGITFKAYWNYKCPEYFQV